MKHRLQTTIFGDRWTLDAMNPVTGEYDPVTEITAIEWNGQDPVRFRCKEHQITSGIGESLDAFAAGIVRLVSPHTRTRPADYTMDMFL